MRKYLAVLLFALFLALAYLGEQWTFKRGYKRAVMDFKAACAYAVANRSYVDINHYIIECIPVQTQDKRDKPKERL